MNDRHQPYEILLACMALALLCLFAWLWFVEPARGDGAEETPAGVDAVQTQYVPGKMVCDTPRTCLGDIEGSTFGPCTVLAIP